MLLWVLIKVAGRRVELRGERPDYSATTTEQNRQHEKRRGLGTRANDWTTVPEVESMVYSPSTAKCCEAPMQRYPTCMQSVSWLRVER